MSTTTLTVSFRHPVLPWAGSPEDDVLFARVRRAVLVVSTVLCLVVLLKPVVVPDRSQAPDLPPRLATMILENAKPPPVIPSAKLVSKPEQPQAVSRNPRDDL